MKRHSILFTICLCLLVMVAGCGESEATPTAVTEPTATIPIAANISAPTAPVAPSPIPPTATDTPEPTATAVSTDTPEPTNTPKPSLPPLPPEAQRIEFQAEDGAALVGYYYPAAVNPAPVVVLMHWAGGDQTDWLYVGMVSWLQNRGAEIPAPDSPLFFDTPYPLPPLADGRSYAVFTFDFRGFGESAAGPMANIVQDAQAAYARVATLPGVDPTQIAGIGASLGALYVADGCQVDCLGALSIGPQDVGEFVYAEVVARLDEAGKPAWCVAAADMEIDYTTCTAAVGNLHQKQLYDSGEHAMRLFRAELGLQPPIETVILNFLQTVFP